MQPVNQEKVRPANLGSVKKENAGASLFSLTERHADAAARIGFVLSCIFLAAAGFYGLHLSGAASAVFDEIAAMADSAAHDAGFRVDDLTIAGEKNAPREDILKALALPYAGSSLAYNTAEAQDRLMKLGWIASAEVRRVLPSRLEVAVSEREPFARWADAENKVQVIDRAGRILGRAEGRFDALPLFAGEGAPSEAAAIIDVLAAHETIRRRIERLEYIAERFWQAKLDDGLVLKLPRKVNKLVLGKIETLMASGKLADLALETIDLRLTNRTILQLREPTLANRDKAIAAINSEPAQPVQPPRRGRAL